MRNDDQKTVLGLLTCGSKEELESSSVEYGEYIPLEIKQLFKNLFTFEIANSYHIAFLAVSKLYRGKGRGIELMNLAEAKWKKSQFDTLSLYTFSCQTSAMKLYLEKGMMVTGTFSVDDRVPCPCVVYFEKNARTEDLQNYFENPSYQNLIL